MPESTSWRTALLTAVLTTVTAGGVNYLVTVDQINRGFTNWEKQQDALLAQAGRAEKLRDLRELNVAFQSYRAARANEHDMQVNYYVHRTVYQVKPVSLFGDGENIRGTLTVDGLRATLERFNTLNFEMRKQATSHGSSLTSNLAHIRLSHPAEAQEIIEAYGEFHNAYGNRDTAMWESVQQVVLTASETMGSLDEILAHTKRQPEIKEYIFLEELATEFNGSLTKLYALYEQSD